MQVSERDRELLAVLKRRNGLMHSAESIAHGRTFKTRPSDVFIVTYPKCGTTWVSAIAHLLRGGNFDDVDEITQAVPWDVVARDCGQDLEAEQNHNPRLYKSHESADTIAKGARYIYVARNPADAFASFYKFLPAYMHVGGLSVDAFAEGIFGGLSHSGGIWDHFLSWHSANHDILWLFYEDVKEDPAREIAKIAKFMGVEVDSAAVERVREATTISAMAARGSVFDDHFVFDRLKKQMDFPPEAKHTTSKVQSGTVGSGRKQLPGHVGEMLDRRWRESVTPKTNFPDYEAMRTGASSSS